MKSQTRHRRSRSAVHSINGQIPLHRNYVFDSNGPNGRMRGTAQQLSEKYQQLARDSKANGDRVQAQALYQYAEHYTRTLALINQNMQFAQQERAERAEQRQRSFENQRNSPPPPAPPERRPRRERPAPQNETGQDESEQPQRRETTPRQWRPSEENVKEEGSEE